MQRKAGQPYRHAPVQIRARRRSASREFYQNISGRLEKLSR